MNLLRVDGAVSFWTLGEWTEYDALADGLRSLGPNFERFIPQRRTPQAALFGALRRKFPKSLLRPLEKRDGFAVLNEERLQDEVVTHTTYAVRIHPSVGLILARGTNYVLLGEIEAEYNRQLAILKPSQVAKSLVQIAHSLGATTLRPTGGIYWIPEQSLAAWDAVADVVQKASIGAKSTVYKIKHQFDADSIRAVRDALLAEVEREVAEITRDVDSGELGERALKARATQAERLQKKIEEYESILGERLPDAREMANRAELTAVAAHIVATAATAV